MEDTVKLEATFLVVRETKNTIRYVEEAESHPLVGTLYVHKAAVSLLGNPKRLKVTIEAA
ncbi:MAG: hypothetical protein EXR55_06365 [Dehalococcoidia bacterium]|nr:hypothetical protein [Dehalococcoidia bacterium]